LSFFPEVVSRKKQGSADVEKGFLPTIMTGFFEKCSKLVRENAQNT
jgi:hypothetical protein